MDVQSVPFSTVKKEVIMRSSGLSLSVAVAAGALLLGAGAQERPSARVQGPSATKAGDSSVSGKPKSSPQQERGLRLLKAAQVEAAALDPELRTYVLWQTAQGYQRIDP